MEELRCQFNIIKNLSTIDVATIIKTIVDCIKSSNKESIEQVVKLQNNINDNTINETTIDKINELINKLQKNVIQKNENSNESVYLL
jgi:hypothetical protein